MPAQLVVKVQSKVRAAFAAGASGKKKLNKREQQDLDSAADTSAQRVLDELDANQDANDGDDDGEEQVRARVANFMRIASMAWKRTLTDYYTGRPRVRRCRGRRRAPPGRRRPARRAARLRARPRGGGAGRGGEGR